MTFSVSGRWKWTHFLNSESYIHLSSKCCFWIGYTICLKILRSYLLMYCMFGHMLQYTPRVGVRGHFSGVGSLLPAFGCQRSNSGCQSRQQSPLCTAISPASEGYFFSTSGSQIFPWVLSCWLYLSKLTAQQRQEDSLVPWCNEPEGHKWVYIVFLTPIHKSQKQPDKSKFSHSPQSCYSLLLEYKTFKIFKWRQGDTRTKHNVWSPIGISIRLKKRCKDWLLSHHHGTLNFQ